MKTSPLVFPGVMAPPDRFVLIDPVTGVAGPSGEPEDPSAVTHAPAVPASIFALFQQAHRASSPPRHA